LQWPLARNNGHPLFRAFRRIIGLSSHHAELSSTPATRWIADDGGAEHSTLSKCLAKRTQTSNFIFTRRSSSKLVARLLAPRIVGSNDAAPIAALNILLFCYRLSLEQRTIGRSAK
jgi:hypothetical protein